MRSPLKSNKSDRFEGLRELAEGRAAQAARSLAQSLGVMRAKETQLRRLCDYLNEYQRETDGAALDAARWENSRRFVALLSDALTLKRAELEAARAHHERDADRWRDLHLKAKALERLADKYYRDELKEMERRDQQELDEQVSRRKG